MSDSTHAVTSSGESTGTTRQPTQLSVLLASAGTPPLDPEAARVAPIRLWDTFALSAERARLFFGARDALFPMQPDTVDPRHDALARILRAVSIALRQRLGAFDAGHPKAELLRGVDALSMTNVENELSGIDAGRRGFAYSAARMLGSTAQEVDPSDDADAGVLRRVVALATRGLVVERAGARGGGVVNDLGAVTLVLAIIDAAANPRSALRGARTRLAKAGKLDERDRARVRDVGQALREMVQHAVSGATSQGSAGRDLPKEATLPAALFDHFVVGLAAAVYNGLAPAQEHPFIVPGVAPEDLFTAAPMLVSGVVTDDSPTLGLYDHIAFVPLPYAPLDWTPAPLPVPARPADADTIDDTTIARAREVLRVRASAKGVGGFAPVLTAEIDASLPRTTWTRATLSDAVAQTVRSAESGSAATHVVVIVGSQGANQRDALDAFARELVTNWHVLAPHETDRTLRFVALSPSEVPGRFRRAALSHWLDHDVARSVRWGLPERTRVVINAGDLGEEPVSALDALLSIVSDIGEREEPDGVLVVFGVPSYRSAANVLATIAMHRDLEAGAIPLRGDRIRLIRVDAPLTLRREPTHACDVDFLADLAQSAFPRGLAELAADTMLVSTDSRTRGHLARIAALEQPIDAALMRALVRTTDDPWSGHAMRRVTQAGVASQATSHALLAAGSLGKLRDCVSHEVGLCVAEWDAAVGRGAESPRVDVARGLLLEHVLSTHPRASVVATEGLAARLAPVAMSDTPTMTDALHASALGVRASGTVHALDASACVPLAFVLRGGVELHVLIDVRGAPGTPRNAPGPRMTVTCKPDDPPGVGLRWVGLWVAALHEAARRWPIDAPIRAATRDGRTTHGALVQVSVDERLVPIEVRATLPLRAGADDGDVQRTAIELVATLADSTRSVSLAGWSAESAIDQRPGTAIPLAGPMLLREFQRRWSRALRILPRCFPVGARSNARYLNRPAITRGSELGLATDVLAERGIRENGASGRAVLTRLPGAASELVAHAKQLGTQLPMRSSSLEGDDFEVLERVLTVAWFLHTNFCVRRSGAIEWNIDEGRSLQHAAETHLDRTAIKLWLQRKTEQPESVEARISELIEHLEPTVVVER